MLTVWQVPDQDVERVGKLFASMPEVSHCYTRTTYSGFPYNLYAMVHAQTQARAKTVVQRMAQKSGVNDFVALSSAGSILASYILIGWFVNTFSILSYFCGFVIPAASVSAGTLVRVSMIKVARQ